jgi:hypothetical protein
MQLIDSAGIAHLAVDCYYLRLLVTNDGRSRATDVQVYAERLEKQGPDGTFELVTRFLPMNLKWTNVGTIYMPLPAGARKHIDLAHVLEPTRRNAFGGEDDPSLNVPGGKTVLSFDVEMKAFTMGHLAQPGVYRLTLDLTSSETRRQRHTIEINHTGEWFDDESAMLSQGVTVKLLK